jgi:uncharacterized protein (TIGR02145 family)
MDAQFCYFKSALTIANQHAPISSFKKVEALMKKNLFQTLALFAALAMLFTACAPAATPVPPTATPRPSDTPMPPSPTVAPTVTDIDGNVYNTVIIGTQTWMKENLRTTKYRNGDTIETTDPATLDISGESDPKYQWVFENDISHLAVYGRLYTWYATTDSRNVCPTGWHVPTNAEWTTLVNFLGGDSVAGGKLKETGTTHWKSPNTGATNESGFTALPGGLRFDNGIFEGGGNYAGDNHHGGSLWSSSENNINAWSWGMVYDTSEIFSEDIYSKSSGFSVRCLKD